MDLGLLRTSTNYSGANKLIEKILQIRTAMQFSLEAAVFRKRSCARQPAEQALRGRISGPCSVYPAVPGGVEGLHWEAGLLSDHCPAGMGHAEGHTETAAQTER